MKKKEILIIFCIFLFLFACNKQKSGIQNNIQKITNNENSIEESIIQTQVPITIFPKIMYVISKEGLRIRSEPSINSDINGLLIYGQRIVIHEKSNVVDTINGLTDYWYRLRLHVDRNDWLLVATFLNSFHLIYQYS